jgi:hypothetical protein
MQLSKPTVIRKAKRYTRFNMVILVLFNIEILLSGPNYTFKPESNRSIQRRSSTSRYGLNDENLRLFCYMDFPSNVLIRTNDSTEAVFLAKYHLINKKQLDENKVYNDTRSNDFINC